MLRSLCVLAAVSAISAGKGAFARDIFVTPENPRGFAGVLGQGIGASIRSSAENLSLTSRLLQLDLPTRMFPPPSLPTFDSDDGDEGIDFDSLPLLPDGDSFEDEWPAFDDGESLFPSSDFDDEEFSPTFDEELPDFEFDE